MDAFAQLALMAKAKRVFESEDTFLSFPALSPIAYPPEQLRFGRPGEMTPQVQAHLSEFARLTNQIPRGVLAPAAHDEYLWDVYRDVLHTAQVAAGDMSADERARYGKAIDFLYTRSADGARGDSQALTAYKQHRDAHIKAQEEYQNQRLTAELSEDTAVQVRWREQEEPRLREEIKRLEQEWLTRGRKAEVEAAQQVELAAASRAPSVTWDDWQSSFLDDLDTATDTSLINYAFTGFSPHDLFDHGSWPRFTLTASEMTQLAREAPSELVDVLGSDQSSAGIESVSFEYRSVAVTRPWFRPALFRSRIWRLPPGAEPLSDGAEPPRGRCPAYISALVFARNVVIQRRQEAGTPAKPHDFRAVLLLDPGVLRVMQPAVVRDHRAAPAGRAHVAAPFRRMAAPLPRAALRAEIAGGVRAATATAPPPTKAAIRLQAVGFGAMVRATDHAAPAAPPPAAPPVDPSLVTVLAFICKRVPLCPHPDPALSWL